MYHRLYELFLNYKMSKINEKIVFTKNTLKLKHLSHQAALPRSCLIFQSTVRTQENHDIFREKLSVTVSLQRPRRCHGALMAFYCIAKVFMVDILCALTVLSLRVHGAHRACAALSRRCHCADPVLKLQ